MTDTVIHPIQPIFNKDSTILSIVLEHSKVKRIIANGNKAYELYNRYCLSKVGHDIIKLPSTSPANASYSLERLIEAWEVIK